MRLLFDYQLTIYLFDDAILLQCHEGIYISLFTIYKYLDRLGYYLIININASSKKKYKSSYKAINSLTLITII